MVFKLALVLSAEMFVLLAAVALLVYITKSNVNKWFTYSVIGIIISVLIMMIFSTVGTLCMNHCKKNRMQNDCPLEKKNCHKGKMDKGMQSGCSHEMIDHGGGCEGDVNECEVEKKCGEKKDCELNNDKMITKEIIICDEDSVQKKIIIKRK